MLTVQFECPLVNIIIHHFSYLFIFLWKL